MVRSPYSSYPTVESENAIDFTPRGAHENRTPVTISPANSTSAPPAAASKPSPRARATSSSSLERRRRRACTDGDHVALGRHPLLAAPRSPSSAPCFAVGRAASPSRATSCATRASGCMVAGAASKVVTAWMGIGLPWGLSQHHPRVRGVGPRARTRSGATSASACASAPPRWVCPSCPRSPCWARTSMGVGGSQHDRRAPTPARRSTPCPRSSRTWRCSTCIERIASATARSTAIRTWTRTSRCASATVLVTAEEIVPEEEIRRHPDRTVIPGFAVDAPRARALRLLPARVLRPLRLRARALQRSTWRASRRDGAAGVERYLERYVYGAADRTPTTSRCSPTACATPPRGAAGSSARDGGEPRSPRRHRQRAARRHGRARALATTRRCSLAWAPR